MKDTPFPSWIECMKIEFCILTGTFLKTLYELRATERNGAFETCENFVAEFCRSLFQGENQLCRRSAFLQEGVPETAVLSQVLLKLGFAVQFTSDEALALGIAAVSDFYAHRTEKMLLAAPDSVPRQVLEVLGANRAAWLACRPCPPEFLSLKTDITWLDFSAKIKPVQKRAKKADSSVKKKSAVLSSVPVSASQPLFSLPVQEENSARTPVKNRIRKEECTVEVLPQWKTAAFFCPEVVKTLRERLHEIQARSRAVKQGEFGKKCSSLKLIDAAASKKETDSLEHLFETAFQSFSWLGAFEDFLTPDHQKLVREYASLGASSLCILRTMYREKFHADIPEAELFSNASRVLQQIRTEISSEIPHSHLESSVSATMIPRNFKRLAVLSSERSAARLRDKIRAHTSFPSPKTPAEKLVFWQELAAYITELGRDFAEKPASEFLIDVLSPLQDEIPAEIQSEGSPSRFFTQVLQELRHRESQNDADFEAGMSASFQKKPSFSELKETQDENILRVRKAFRGTQMVFIGGTPNTYVKQRLETLFGVTLIWEECPFHLSLDRYQPWIQSPNVSCFLVKRSVCSHMQNMELVRDIRQAGKKCVRLQNESHPATIAAKIVKQCLPSEENTGGIRH